MIFNNRKLGYASVEAREKNRIKPRDEQMGYGI